MKHLITYGLPGLAILIFLPLALGLVPPNGLYGFRTPKTLSSSEVWFAANKVGGWIAIGASFLFIGFAFMLPRFRPDWPEHKQIVCMALAYPPFLVVALVLSLAYVRRL